MLQDGLLLNKKQPLFFKDNLMYKSHLFYQFTLQGGRSAHSTSSAAVLVLALTALVIQAVGQSHPGKSHAGE